MVLDDAKKSKRFGFVSFSRASDAQTVLNSGKFFMCGKQIVVGPAVKRVVRIIVILNWVLYVYLIKDIAFSSWACCRSANSVT